MNGGMAAWKATLRGALPRADGVQELRRAQENAAVGDGGRTQRVARQIVLRQHLEFRSGPDHRGEAVLVADVKLAIRQHRRRAVDGRLEPLAAPDLLRSEE